MVDDNIDVDDDGSFVPSALAKTTCVFVLAVSVGGLVGCTGTVKAEDGANDNGFGFVCDGNGGGGFLDICDDGGGSAGGLVRSTLAVSVCIEVELEFNFGRDEDGIPTTSDGVGGVATGGDLGF